MTYTLVLVQTVLMLLLPGSHRAPVGSGWSGVKFDVPVAWSIGDSRYLASSMKGSPGRSTGSSAASGVAMSYSLKRDLASLSAIPATAMSGGTLLTDRVSSPSPEISSTKPAETSPSPVGEQYASTARLYYVPAGLLSFSGDSASASASLDSVVTDPTDSTPGGGLGGGTDVGVTPPPDLGGGSSNHGGIHGTTLPEPSSALMVLVGLSITCRRRRVR